ncbi:excinuclease ABC subunit UvrC [Spirulina sp. CCNP1310]|uniref:excinuclease ABC subunit UvrC n=1 Tax=Spirulina sp. CCNP1310 TaxID=3110249 RepID=UPI002B209FD0|nr:excinuclease ABC subunit UvrC [Spirulina sp. CCNP1310]MEA5418208.1 excinuclease ABC subunit UvrC [Spirulina sp. CCNP1310]
MPSRASVPIAPIFHDPDRLAQRLKEIPPEPGVYLMRDRTDGILYIGKSKKLRSRVRSYFRDGQRLSDRIAMMVRQVVEIEFIVTDSEAEALALEANLIKTHQPYFNVLLKDDKKYPYVCITWSEAYPRIFLTRKRRATQAADRYYGPYVDVRSLRETLRLIQEIFPLRQRRRPLFKDRPCLNYDIGRCPGVCQSLITPEDYHAIVQKVAMIFQGRSGELIDQLTQQMNTAAADLAFEQAARLRDQIRALQSLHGEQKMSLPDDTVSRDAIALAAQGEDYAVQLFQMRAGKLVGRLGFFAQGDAPGAVLQRVLEEHYRGVDGVEIPQEILVQYELPQGEMLTDWLTGRRGRKVQIFTPQRQQKAELIELVERNAQYELERAQRLSDRNHTALEDLALLLDLPEPPQRIEGYDISHIQGSNAVASQVVFIAGMPAKQHYRHYKIQNPAVHNGRSDDFASLAEVMGRRFRRYGDRTLPRQGDPDFPDLVLIDGGKGQLSAVVKVLQQLDLLEDLRVISLAKRREEVFLPGATEPLATEPEQPGVQLLRRVRDESHRFALGFHRQQRLKASRRSQLDQIPGLGFHRQKLLLAHFRSVDYIRAASVAQLEAVPGIGPHIAQTIYDYFHPPTA